MSTKINLKLSNNVVVKNLNPTNYQSTVKLIQAYFKEDHKSKISSTKILTTFFVLAKNPNRGSVLVFQRQQKIIGYAILIYYWSNEFSGEIIYIDELYVAPEERGKGLATAFISKLANKAVTNVKAIQLEYTRTNLKAKKLYTALGFKKHSNTHMIYVMN